MIVEMKTVLNKDLSYLIEQIRSNLLILDGNETTKETPRAHAWLLTTLSIYGNDLNVLIELYRLFREQSSYILLTFIIEHILQYHLNTIEKNDYLQEEFQLIFASSSSKNPIEKEQFSYAHLYTLLSSSIREIISTLLIRKWYDELEENLLSSFDSPLSFVQCREKALACLALSSSSISSILQLIINTEAKLHSHTKLTSLNLLRCLFVQDLLPIALENRQRFDIQSHLCHKWLIYAMEFYLEYFIRCFQNNQMTSIRVNLQGNYEKTFQCDQPIEQIEKLITSAVNVQQNFNWQQYQGNQISSNRRQKLLELRLLIDRAHQSSIRCPLECYIFCTSFPTFVHAIVKLSTILDSHTYRDHIFLCSTGSLKRRTNKIDHFDLIENFYLFLECLQFFQSSSTSSCVKLYQEIIDKIQLNTSIPIYQRLLKIFYFHYHIQKLHSAKTTQSIEQTKQNPTVTIDDTPQSPTMQDDCTNESISPLIAPDFPNFVEQLNDKSLESRLQLCSLSHAADQRTLTISHCIDTLVYLHSNSSSYNHEDKHSFLSISSEFCFVPRSAEIFFDYLLDILLINLPPNLVLLQISQQSSLTVYPKDLFRTLTPPSLRYIYDPKLLGGLMKYVQTSQSNERRWTSSTNKRKLDHEENKLTDEQFIEKIIQHVSHVTQWTDEQRRHAIYTYILDERQTLLQSLP